MAAELGDRFALSPDVEAERLYALRQLHILHTPPEERFARITRLARLVFRVPMAAISLIDAHSQWFKQVDGLDIGAAVPREQTVCRAVISRGYTHPESPELVIPDLSEDPDFADLPGVIEGGIRFYAGMPLYGPDGHAVGTLCVYDTAPREMTPDEITLLHELSGWVQRELEQSDEMERAALVQRRLLPGTLGDLPGYAVSALCIPALAVGGDFYDHYPARGGTVFTLADVMGKGLGAAILAATVRAALRAATRALDHTDPVDLAAAVATVVRQIAEDLDNTESFVTLLHARLDAATGTVNYVDAGHGLVSVITRNGAVQPLPGDGLPLGINDELWTARSLTLEPGDTLAVASDGLLELLGDDGGVQPTLEFFAAHPDPEQMCRRVRELASARKTLDDVTVLALRRENGT